MEINLKLKQLVLAPLLKREEHFSPASTGMETDQIKYLGYKYKYWLVLYTLKYLYLDHLNQLF